MADGSQGMFHLPMLKATSRLRPGEIVVDLFAGGGGASTALEQALGRPVDIAINHNPWAVSMHAANHPYTRHLCEDVWKADPVREVAGRAVGWLHASPDCTHFSQAKGGQPRNGKVRALSWCVLRWAGTTRPRIISLENVHQILKWGPLVAKRCKATGRVLKLDGTVAARGERVPVDQQFLIPDKRQEGRTWRQFVSALRTLGYAVEWKRLKACDFGAGTSRERLFLVARRDGKPIVWPAPTHGPGRAQPYVTAADCIDWSIACPSIFTRAKPLADATMRRIARGIRRYVLDAAEPFIVPNNTNNAPKATREPLPAVTTCQGRNLLLTPTIVQCANASANGVADGAEPLGTVTSWPKGGAHAVAAATLVQAAHGEGRPGGVQRWGSGARAVDEPAGTFTASGSGGYALAAATLIQTGYGERPGQEPRVPGLDKPVGTLVDGQKHAAVTAALVKVGADSDADGRYDRTPLTEERSDHALCDFHRRELGCAARTAESATRVRRQAKARRIDRALCEVCADRSLRGPDGVALMRAGDLRAGNHDAAGSGGCDSATGPATVRGRDGVDLGQFSAAFLEQAAGGPNSNTSRPRAASEPVSTISTKGSQQRLVAANMVTLRRNCDGADAAEPVRTITAGAEHHAVVECTLSPEHEAGALQVAAFLLRYYGTGGQWGELTEPSHAITTKDRLALVTVTIRGTPYVIVDIGLRMLQRHELFRAQGFPPGYIIDRTADGRTLSVSRSVSMCGNSVSPPPHCAIVEANADPAHLPASIAA